MRDQRGCSPIGLSLLVGLLFATPAAACPFCSALGPTLSERRDQATMAAVIELATNDTGSPEWIVPQSIRGPAPAPSTLGTPPLGLRHGLVLAFGEPATAPSSSPAVAAQAALGATTSLGWNFIPISEVACGYLIRAPQTRSPTAERLRYFARWLEHADPLIAEDAYLEFGHAPFDDVAEVVDALDMRRLRDWMVDEAVPPSRKGFYGLALGLAREPQERKLNRELLERLMLAPADGARAGADFRAGFDGVLGGYLMLSGAEGLDVITRRYFANPHAAAGDLRHALTALRFYHEYGHEIPAAAQAAALRRLAEQPQLADVAIVDLARWQDWASLPIVESVYGRAGFDEPRVRRAVVGYLQSCPLPAAAKALAALRNRDPLGVQAAERALGQPLAPATTSSSSLPQ